MARLIRTPSAGDGPVGAFEPKVLEQLLARLPATFAVSPNFQLKPAGQDALEYDFVVLAPHALYVVEAKEWYGRLTGDDQEWLLNQRPKRCPLWLVNLKCKVLKTALGPLGSQVYVAPLLVVPNGTILAVGGNWREATVTLEDLPARLRDPSAIPRSGKIGALHGSIEKVLQGAWGARRRGMRRQVAGYEILETLTVDGAMTEYLARPTLIQNDPSRFRIRTWRLDLTLGSGDIERQRTVYRRPSEALARIGPHPNLLGVRHFAFDEDESEFQEITDWSEFGKLHGYLENAERDPLTLRERLETAAGVAAALEAVHAQHVVHRNVCPETILIGFDRRPRLTDFDRSFLPDAQSVFQDTGGRRNPAYLAPELAEVEAYEFGPESDMYSFGALLYRLLTDEVPFKDPEEARARGGVPHALPSDVREGVPSDLDQLVLDLLRVEPFQDRPSAAQAGRILRQVLGEASQPPLVPDACPEVVGPSHADLQVGQQVGAWRIDARVGSGAFSRVYRVFNLDHQRTYAMKVLSETADPETILREYRDFSQRIPTHPNIGRLVWMERLGPPDNRPYLVSEFIEGTTLEPYCNGRLSLSWIDIKRIGAKMLDALAVLHDRNILHRDVKPANIMLALPTHEPKLIDFNISSPMEEATGRAGTPRYWAPDRGRPEWRPDMDLFSLGVVLYELVLHIHPYAQDRPGNGPPIDPRLLRTTLPVGDALAGFLLKAVQPLSANRFASAAQMKLALASIDAMYAPAPPRQPALGEFPGITVEPWEAAERNYNPYVTRLLSLYSQAKRTNAGTRGLDEIGRFTYVPTRLDTDLAPAIASGNHRLVVVTGNAGDGKTAFLQEVERMFESRGVVVERLATRNGSRWEHGGLQFETNYDGSQDEGDRASDEVLERFLSPFEDGSPPNPVVRLLAINEGRLLDFLLDKERRDRFRMLRGKVQADLDGDGGAGGSQEVLLVNLNLRALTAGGRDSLLERQLLALLRPELWAPCERCAHRRRCHIRHNVDSLADPASGQATRDRLRRIYEMAHLRRQAHATMRDLRSSLSWLLMRDHDCRDVAEVLARADSGAAAALAWLAYPNAYADGGPPADPGLDPSPRRVPLAQAERAVDRLVDRLREGDVGAVDHPGLDRRLADDPASAAPWMTYESRSDTLFQSLVAASRSAPALGDGLPLADVIARRRALASMWRRWAYFERRDEGWAEMLPFRVVHELEAVLSAPSGPEGDCDREAFRDLVLNAVSAGEGLRDPEIRKEHLALRVSRVRNPSVRSFRLFPKRAFSVLVPQRSGAGSYIEAAPDLVEVVANPPVAPLGTETSRGGSNARLRISLDLFEMMSLIGAGHRPTISDLQGLFVNLVIFRNELLASTFDRVLLTIDDDEYYEVSAEGGVEGIALRLAKRGRAHGPETSQQSGSAA